MPHQAAISLSTQTQSFSSPVNLASGAHTLLISESQGEQDQTLGSSSKAGGRAVQPAGGTGGSASCPGATALGLGQPLLVLPLICSTLSSLFQLPFSSDVPGTGPCLTWEKQCHVHQENFSDPPLSIHLFLALPWGCCVLWATCSASPSHRFLFCCILSFRDKGT